MLVYREGRRTRNGRALVERLRQASSNSFSLITALLLAGELECGIGDACGSHDQRTKAAAKITDVAARAFLRSEPGDLDRVAALAERLSVPEELRVSAPEGFAYYALDPRKYADLAGSVVPKQAAVMGIRSIGTTLSAVVCEAFRRCAISAERITVRPQGHPFDRETRFSAEEKKWVNTHSSGEFWIVDEGPGLSGSSFLSVGDALLAEGVSTSRIHFVCGYTPDPASLCARDAAARWQKFRSHAVSGNTKPSDADIWIGGGEWRDHFLGNAPPEHWPVVWKSVERAKYLSRDRTAILKFEGFGHYGEGAVARSRRLADEGFTPAVKSFDPERGFAEYELVPGRIATRNNISEELLRRMASYCAARACLFSAAKAAHELATMAQVNAQKALGIDLDLDSQFCPVVRPVVSDGRMMPHEWIFADDGRILKLDAASHGDDHFFPGPCDIAWDLAGAIIEWDLNDEASGLLLDEYQRLSGDDAARRMFDYLLAYSLFRVGYCHMAGEATKGSDERARLERASKIYQARAEAYISAFEPGRPLAHISG